MTHVVDTEIIEGLGNLDLLGEVEEGIGELFTLTKRALDNLEVVDIAQEVADWLVWIRPVCMWV